MKGFACTNGSALIFDEMKPTLTFRNFGVPFGVPDLDVLGVTDSLYFTLPGVLFLGVRRPTGVSCEPDLDLKRGVRGPGVVFVTETGVSGLQFELSVVADVDKGGNRCLDFRLVKFLSFIGESFGLNSSADSGVETVSGAGD